MQLNNCSVLLRLSHIYALRDYAGLRVTSLKMQGTSFAHPLIRTSKLCNLSPEFDPGAALASTVAPRKWG